MSGRVVVVTVAAGRHRQLVAQRAGLRRGRVLPYRHLVVSMGDTVLIELLAAERLTEQESGFGTETLLVEADEQRLPLAAARNAGAERAIALGADLLVFLDVDVVPGADLLRRYREAATHGHNGSVLSGPVVYLPAGVTDPDRFGDHAAHPARPDPPAGEVWPGASPDLFWSLSFAVTPAGWRRVGGFWTGYRGYGGEDTDFGRSAVRAGVPLAWVGGATGYHQHHPVSDPPVEHLDDILRNGRLFRDRWGEWPMSGWLAAFERLGLVRRLGTDWVRAEPPVPGR